MEEILSCIETARAVVALISRYILSSTPLADQSAVLHTAAVGQAQGVLATATNHGDASRTHRATVFARAPDHRRCFDLEIHVFV
jgi:Cft2 family RNA processing exonuclease